MPATDTFFDLDEALIKLTYGALLEFRHSVVEISRLSEIENKIRLFHVAGSKLLLGCVTFGKYNEKKTPSTMVENKPNIPDQTRCKVSVKHKSSPKPFKFQGVTVPDILRLGVTYDLLLLLKPMKSDLRLPEIIDAQSNLKNLYQCFLTFDVYKGNIRDQINAVNKLRGKKFERWNPILLNQEYTGLETIDLFQGLKNDEIQAAYNKLFESVQWNKSQAELFNLMRKVPGNGVAFVEGNAGCGKTLALAKLCSLLVELGKHVIIVAPTNAAVLAISRTFRALIPRITSSLTATRSDGDDVLRCDGDADDTDQDTIDIFHLFRPSVQTSTVKFQVLPEHDLQEHVDRLVKNFVLQERTLGFTYHPPRKEPTLLNSDEGEQELTEEKYDAIAMYNRHKDADFRKMLSSCTDEESKETILKERTLFKKALGVVRAAVIAESKVLLCTHQIQLCRQ